MPYSADVRSIRAEILTPPKQWVISMLLVIFSVVVFCIIWASLAELDEVTKGMGQVTPSSKVQVVQNLEGGILREIFVKEGEAVEKGQVLVRIDDTSLVARYRENRARYFGFLATATRLRAELSGDALEFPVELIENRPELVAREKDLYESRKQEFENSIHILNEQVSQREQELSELMNRREHLKESYKLAQEETGILEPLVGQGIASKVELLRLKRELTQIKSDVDATNTGIERASAAMREAKSRIEERKTAVRAENLKQMNEATSQHRALKEFLTDAEDRVTRTEVRSPVKGLVKQLMVNSEGEVVQPGADIAEIVPLEDQLLVQARIKPDDVAFISPGQKAIVKVTAYDFLIYGGLDAVVEKISPDTIMDEKGNFYYQIYVRTHSNFLDSPKKGRLYIKPGMVVEADILTGKKTVLQYLLKPVNRARHNAMREP